MSCGMMFVAAMVLCSRDATAVQPWPAVRLATHARIPRVLGHPEAGYVELYEFDMWLNEVGPSEGHVRRCGAPPYENTTHDGTAPFDILPGTYAALLHQPEWFVRPTVVPDMVVKSGGTLERNIIPALDYCCVSGPKLGPWKKAGGPEPWEWAKVFHQTFVAHGTSITHAHFKLAGAKTKSARVSIHRVRPGQPPEQWPQVGPERVDAKAGTLNDNWVAWRSGEVPSVAGETYAMRIEGWPSQQEPGLGMVVHRDDLGPGYDQGTAWADGVKQKYDIYGSVGSDSDGTVVPYMRVFDFKPGQLGGWGAWGQSWVAQGTSLAGVDFLVGWTDKMKGVWAEACVHEDDPKGKVVGVAKRMQAAWWGPGSGFLGAAWQPGEVQLQPGKTYCVEFHAVKPCPGYSAGIVNHPDNAYPRGNAFRDGKPVPDKDLEMTIVEYAQAVQPPKPYEAYEPKGKNLLVNGDFAAGTPHEGEDKDPPGWTRWKSAPTTFWYGPYGRNGSQAARVIGGSINDTAIDGGLVQQVKGLNKAKTYCLAGWTISSAQTDKRYLSAIGYDPTGQTNNPKAATILWEATGRHGAAPDQAVIHGLRPRSEAISVWTRGTSQKAGDLTFTVDFDDFSLVEEGSPSR